MKSLHLFHFTPSMMPPETLEELFVQREPLAQRLSDLIRESVLTQNKHHTLLVGPRGIGKTHLVALTYYRVKAMTDLRDQVYVAWLREEEWGVESFLDLLLRVCRALQEEYPDTFPAERVEALYQQDPATAQHLAGRLLQEFLGNRTLLLLVENLDDLFKGIGDKGQRQFRAFIQGHPVSTILATSQSLFNGVSRQTAPFYGFFRVHHLEDFSVDDATLLLRHIAELKEDQPLAAFIETPTGRARVRTVNHLAGGNPRVYVIFSEFLTRDSLDELVGPFMSVLDELTPYYQARMSYLSVQQRKIVEFLCDRGTPATVKEIANRCFISSQTASSQLRDLKERGYVNPDPLGPTGRDTYYELREPLMRMSLELKKSRSGPIRLLIDFLRLWYPVTELRHQLDSCRPDAEVEREYLTQAIKAAEDNPDPRLEACYKAYTNYYNQRQFAQALAVAEELVALRQDADTYYWRGFSFLALEKTEQAFSDFDQSIETDASKPFSWAFRGVALERLGRYEEAVVSVNRAIELDPKKALHWSQLADVYDVMGEAEKSLEAWDVVVKLQPQNAYSWARQGAALFELGRHEKAEKSLNKAVKLDPTLTQAWLNLIDVQYRLKQLDKALCSSDRLIELDKAIGIAWWQRGTILTKMRSYQEALKCYDKAIELRPDIISCAYFDRAEALFRMKSSSDALASVAGALQRTTDPDANAHVSTHSTLIVRMMLRSSSDAETWVSDINSLVQIYIQHGFIAALEPALVNSVYDITESRSSGVLLEEWYEAWKKAVGHLPQFELPLRLLDTAIRYDATQDKRILLELPVEERKVLEGLLKSAEKDNSEG